MSKYGLIPAFRCRCIYIYHITDSVFLPFQVLHLREELEREHARKLAEVKEAARRMKEDCEHQVEMERLEAGIMTKLAGLFFACRASFLKMRVILGVRTRECFVIITFVLSSVLTSFFSLFYVTREVHRFLHRG